MEQWYLLYSKPHREGQLRDELARKGVRVYLPLCPLRGRQKSPQPLFLRYLFARLDVHQAEPQITRWLPGLSHFVMFGDEYATVPDSVITYIKQREAEMHRQQAIPFRAGQRVRIAANHPLAMLDAVFEKPLAGGARARILLEVLGRLTRCEVDICDLEAVPAGEQHALIVGSTTTRGTRAIIAPTGS